LSAEPIRSIRRAADREPAQRNVHPGGVNPAVLPEGADPGRKLMKLAGILAAASFVAAIPVTAAPQRNAGAAAAAEKTITLRGCVAPGVEKGTYILSQLSQATAAGESGLPESAHGRRVVFWLDHKDEMLKHLNKAVEVTGKVAGVEDSKIEIKNGDARDGGVLVEFEGPGKDVRASETVARTTIGTSGTSPDTKDIQTMVVKVNVTGVTVAADYPCAVPK
jgi:hypothetical protein